MVVEGGRTGGRWAGRQPRLFAFSETVEERSVKAAATFCHTRIVPAVTVTVARRSTPVSLNMYNVHIPFSRKN